MIELISGEVCAICSRDVDPAGNNSSQSSTGSLKLVEIFLKCMQKDFDIGVDEIEQQIVHNITAVFCSCCKILLEKWEELQSKIRLLEYETDQVRIRLCASVLLGFKGQSSGCRKLTGSAEESKSWQRRYEEKSQISELLEVKDFIRKKFDARVLVEKLPIPKTHYTRKIKTSGKRSSRKQLLSDSSEGLLKRSEDLEDPHTGRRAISEEQQNLRPRVSAPIVCLSGDDDSDGVKEESQWSDRDIDWEGSSSNSETDQKISRQAKRDSVCEDLKSRSKGSSGKTKRTKKEKTEDGFEPSVKRLRSVKHIGSNEFLYKNEYKFRSLEEGKWECSICYAKTMTRNGMLGHMKKVHTPDRVPVRARPYRQISPNEFLYMNAYRVTFNDGRYRCEECGLVLEERKNMHQHVRRIHMGIKPIRKKQQVRGQAFREVRPNEFLYHEKFPYRFDSIEKTYVCGLCDHRHPDLRSMFPHIRANHFTAEEKQHLRGVEVEPGKYLYAGKYGISFIDGRYRCDLCMYDGEVIWELYPHIRQYHFPQSGDVILGDRSETLVQGSQVDVATSSAAPLDETDAVSRSTEALLEPVCEKEEANAAVNSDDVTVATNSESNALNLELAEDAYDAAPSTCHLVAAGWRIYAGGRYVNSGFEVQEQQDGTFRCLTCGFDNSSRKSVMIHVKRSHAKSTQSLPSHSASSMEAERVAMEAPSTEANDITTQQLEKSREASAMNRLIAVGWKILENGRYAYGDFIAEKQDDGSFKCLTCGLVNSNQKCILIHVRLTHAIPESKRRSIGYRTSVPANYEYQGLPYSFDPTIDRFRCGLCHVINPCRRKMKTHITRKHLHPEKFICDICGLETDDREVLRRHRERHGEAKHACQLCDKRFTCRDYLLTHMKIHKGDDAKKYQCEFCGKKFHTKKQFSNHRTTHTGEKPFACDLCGESFSTTFKRREHRKLMHGGAPQQWRPTHLLGKNSQSVLPTMSLPQACDSELP